VLNSLEVGTIILSADGHAFTVDEQLAAAFQPGDLLVANRNAGLLHVPAVEREKASTAVSAAMQAFEAMGAVPNSAIIAFYDHVASALEDDVTWNKIAEVNAGDVESARARGRSTTRLSVSDSKRKNMIDGLRGWATLPSRRGAILETIHHDGFRVEMVGAALGVIAFVFEGRPNVLTDACGVLRGGNAVVFRIGGDALATAQAIMNLVVNPGLEAAGLPAGAVSLVESTAHAAGWSLFLDDRLSLAVARGSGPAVDLLGSLARSVGTPVSLHGTGGAWIVVSKSVGSEQLKRAIVRSLDRKVCNTLNTCCLVAGKAQEHAPILLEALEEAGVARGQSFKLHIAEGSEFLVPKTLFESTVEIVRAEGRVTEAQVETIPRTDLGVEWEWEEAPEITLTVVDSIDEAVSLFNTQSPRLVGTLVSNDPAEHDRFFELIDAPFVGDDHTRWVDGQYALNKPELGLSNWEHGRLFGRSGVLTGDSVYTVRTRYFSE
jgi:glutamate-5-semialdehyde dehydrogenase